MKIFRLSFLAVFFINLFFSVINTNKSYAQAELCKDIPKERQGNITIHADPKLNEIIYLSKTNLGDKEPELQGFRLQVYNGTDRNEANRLKNQLSQLYPGHDVYLKYEQPRFKVRIGDFRNRIEAQKLYSDLRTAYEGVFIVPEKIGFPKLQVVN